MNSKSNSNHSPAIQPIEGYSFLAPQVGKIHSTDEARSIFVQWGTSTPQKARLVAELNRSELANPESQGRDVLLVFENGNPERPIIIGVLSDPLDDLLAMDRQKATPEEPKDVTIDGKRLTLEGYEEVVLKCGKGSLTIRKDGKILIKGTHVLSRATGPNRIKGGSVQIN